MQTNSIFGLTTDGFHKVVYYEWGEADNPNVLICVHGLTRNGRDFDFLAKKLKQHYRIICPDIVGRGQSDWLKTATHYHPPQYLSDMAILLTRINAKKITWLGTSMGGLMGIVLAALPQTPIERLILNDAGPFIAASALANLNMGLTPEQKFPTEMALNAYLKQIYNHFGPLPEEVWQHLTQYDKRQNADGSYSRNYDPSIAHLFTLQSQADVNLWPYWMAITQPTLVIRGQNSQILTPETVQQMQLGKPNVKAIEIANVGHPPSLMVDSEINQVVEWLMQS